MLRFLKNDETEIEKVGFNKLRISWIIPAFFRLDNSKEILLIPGRVRKMPSLWKRSQTTQMSICRRKSLLGRGEIGCFKYIES